GEQSGRGTQKARESCARQGVFEKGKEKAVERESCAVQTDKEKAIERESSAPVDKGKSKVSSVFGKRRARASGKRRYKNVKKTQDKEDQRSNTLTKGLVENEVVEATWVGDGAKGKKPDSTNAGVESWDLGADLELDSEKYDSDNVQSKYDSDDDTPMKDRWPDFNPATDMGDPQFKVRMKFSDCQVFRYAVKEQFVKMNRDVVFVRSEAFKLKAACADPNCPWEIYASKMQHENTL
ncbi:unnamed protein product, partial [Prunus brigantina]